MMVDNHQFLPTNLCLAPAYGGDPVGISPRFLVPEN